MPSFEPLLVASVLLVPQGPTVLRAGDELTMLASPGEKRQVEELLARRAPSVRGG